MTHSISRRDFHRLFGAGSAALLASCAFTRPAFAGLERLPVKGGVLRVAAASEPSVLTELMQSSGSAGVGPRVQEGLLEERADRQLVGALAQSWQISADGRTYHFALRQGVLWHDGKPFTSADVKTSITLLKELHPRRRATFASLSSIETPSDHEVILQFAQPVPYLLRALSGLQSPMVPAHLYDGTDPRTNPANSAPIGTGPFRFVEWQQGSHYYLEANRDYYDAERPLLEGVLVRFFPDAQSRAAALEAGEVDIALANALSYDDITRLRDTGRFAVSAEGYGNSGTLAQLFINQRTEALQKLEVRQAIAHAIDVQDLIRRVYRDFAVPAATAISPLTPAYHDESLAHYAFDRAKAEALLDGAGYPKGADGKRLTLRLTHNTNPSLQQMAQVIRSSLAEIGIEAQLQTYDFATYVRKIYTEGAFDLDVQNLVSGYDPTDGVQRAYHSANIREGLAWSNHTHYRNARVDEIFDLASRENDEARRRALYVELQQILHHDLPAVNLLAYQLLTLSAVEVQDHTTTQSAGFQPFDRAWIAQS